MNSTVISNTTRLHETISQAEALKLAKRVSGQNAQLVGYQLRPYNSHNNLIVTRFQLVLEIKSNESSAVEQHSFFVKTRPGGNLINEKHDFEQEFTFFHDIVPQLMKHVDVGRWVPKCFLAKSDILVLENLTTKGYSVRQSVFDEETARSALRSVARLHASSILAETRLGKSLYELCPKAFRDKSFAISGKSQGWFSAANDATVKVAHSMGLNSSKISAAFDRLQQIITEENEALLGGQRKYKVSSHGDLWASNMMFDDNQNCILLKFKSLRYASPAQDVLLLLHLCTTREFRRQLEEKSIEFYHSTLRTLAYKYDPAARVLPIDQLKREIEEQRLRAVVAAAAYLPIVLLDKIFAADVLEDPVKYDEFQCRDRGRKVVELMQRDESYRQRVEEAVSELVEYSEKYF